jgi:hypothetical protein
MIPTTAVIFMVVSQNSISPYLRTLNILKAKGIPIAIDIHTAELTWVFGIQNDIVLAAATSFAGKATVYLLVIEIHLRLHVYQYIHPQAKPWPRYFRDKGDLRETDLECGLIAQTRRRVAEEMIPSHQR